MSGRAGGRTENSPEQVEMREVTADGAAPAQDHPTTDLSTRTGFLPQMNALLRKNAVLQKRAKKTNACQCCFPLFLLGILLLMSWLSRVLTEDKKDDDLHPEVKDIPSIFVGDFRNDHIPYVDTTPSVGTYYGQGSPDNTGMLKYYSSDGVRTKGYMPPMPAFDEYASKSRVDEKLYDTYKKSTVMAAYLFEENVPDSKFRYALYYNASVNEAEDGGFGRESSGQDIPGTLFMMSRAVIRSFTGNENGSFVVRLRELATKADTTFTDFVPFVEPLYYTWILHFLMPVFIEAIVFEKQQNLRDIMRMMGLKMKIYWAVQYLFDWILYLSVLLVLISAGLALQFRFFTQNAFGLYFVLFLIWGFTLTAMSFLASTLFSNTRASTILSYFYIILMGIAANITVQQLVSEPSTSTSSYFFASLIPTFALNRGLYYLSNASGNRLPGLTWSEANKGGNRLFEVYAFLAVEAVLMYLLAVYFESVIPSGGGIKKHPLFCFMKTFWSKKARKEKEAKEMDALHRRRSFIETCTVKEPADVRAERDRSDANYLTASRGIFVHNLHKRFMTKNRKIVAIRNLALTVAEGECVGLLGHNGAGKTTLINILSGLFSPTSGTVNVYGYDLAGQMSKIYGFMGVCPQFDVLWDEQTGREHLLFYGRLKGLSGKELKEAVDSSLESVNLSKFGTTRVKGYSGGMKRRLSVAIALIGAPKVVFLDEPTTGLDPHSRREVWDAIDACKAGRSIILTTHSMEEADALCDRIGVMSKGRLQCIGYSQQLKARFGEGYKLQVSCLDPARLPGIHRFIAESYPGSTLLDSLAGTSTFLVPFERVVMSSTFTLMMQAENELGMSDWGISTTTLEEVFVRLTRQAAEEEKKLEKEESMMLSSRRNSSRASQ